MTSFKRNLPQGRGSFVGENSYTSTNESFVQRSALLPAYGGIGLYMHPLAITGAYASSTFGGVGRLQLVLASPVLTTTLITAGALYVNTLAANSSLNIGLYTVEDDSQTSVSQFKLVPGSTASVLSDTTGRKIFRYTTPVQLNPGVQYLYAVNTVGGNPSVTAMAATAGASKPARSSFLYAGYTSGLPGSIPTNTTSTLNLASAVVTFLTKQYEFLL